MGEVKPRDRFSLRNEKRRVHPLPRLRPFFVFVFVGFVFVVLFFISFQVIVVVLWRFR